MKLVVDEDVEIMLALYFENQSDQIASIQLFIELADLESAKDYIPLGKEHGVQDLCTVVSMAYVDSRSIVHGINIDLNAAFASKNLNSGPRLQIHLMVLNIDADSDYGYDNNNPSNHKVEDYSDSNLDRVLDNIDDKDTDNDRNTNVYIVVNLIRDIYDTLATLMPRMGPKQVNQMEVRHVFVEHVKKVMVANYRIVRHSWRSSLSSSRTLFTVSIVGPKGVLKIVKKSYAPNVYLGGMKYSSGNRLKEYLGSSIGSNLGKGSDSGVGGECGRG
ncbi:hypothetical protein J1N35_037992 [Gossypium stocksii]|uniref:Uncharacterized protein n=1 Tax=Gossypium stocksii TaxID=47602 RepID=A0A9D3ZM86_9ROSI|nr:hypothetical protein J1N35_037992 [Gossypium stocksii]